MKLDEGRRAKTLRTGMVLAGIVVVYIAALIGYMVLR